MFSNVEVLLSTHPLRTVIMLRAPFLGSGILNYVFALSSLHIVTYIKGNLLGYIPGCILFSILGSQARSLGDVIYHGNTSPAAIATLVCVTVAVIATVISILIIVRKKTRTAIQTEQQHTSAAEDVLSETNEESVIKMTNHAETNEPITVIEIVKQPIDSTATETEITKHTATDSS